MSTFALTTDKQDDLLLVRPGKWTLVVVTRLRSETRRFSELRREISGISQKTLTSTLRDLERDGFILRTMFPTIPPRVDYELTALGHELLALADSWRRFADTHREAVLSARNQYDRSGGESAVRLIASS